jgi:hypothetical protein
VLAAYAGVALVTSTDAETPVASSEIQTEAIAEQPAQLFELRIYTAAPGKMESLHQRFRDHTLRIFEKHGIKSIGYWTSESEPDRLYYVVAYPDRESREQRLVNGIAKDPEFLKVVAESEKDGKLTTSIESVILTPTEYSPMK